MNRAADPLRALQSLRDVEVPVGARSRVRARIESQLDRRAIMRGPTRRRWLVGVLAAPLAAVLVLALWPRSEPRAVSVAAGERHEVELASGHVSIHGPAEVAISRDQLSLVQGTVEAQGQLRVKGPSCDVVVQGAAEVSVTGAKLRVRVFAGSVQVVPPVITCEVIDLSPRRPITASGAHKPASHALSASAPSAALPAETTAPALEGTAAPPPLESSAVLSAVSPPLESSAVSPSRQTSATPPSAPARSVRSAPIAPPSGASMGAARSRAPSIAPPSAAPVDAATSRASANGAPSAALGDAAASRAATIARTSATPGDAATSRAPSIASRSAALVEGAAARAPSTKLAPTDPLADAVAAYHAAVALEARDLAAARAAWQVWRTRWPNSPLAQSVDLHLLAVLDRLGRHGEASDLARDFVRRYPRSPRRAEVQRLIVGAP